MNVFGYDFYKECIARGSERVRDLGPVLGGYHPVLAYNVRRLLEISGMDEISFHMSGTEAVMQAVRLARYHTRPQPPGALLRRLPRMVGRRAAGRRQSARRARDLHARGYGRGDLCKVLRSRRDIACVLVNPLQALHPNANAPGDSALIDSGRSAHFDRAALSRHGSRNCAPFAPSARIVLIFDEVFVGFRLARGGAQEYFGVRADMVTYGKTVAGGLPVGVLCGRAEFMRRFREDRPADICFARGTFNSHPYVMGAMCEFLERLDGEPLRSLYRDLDGVWNERARSLNERLSAEHLPVQGREPLHDLDDLLHAAVALQLDVSILLTRGGHRPELGGHGPADLQLELHGGGFRGGRRPDSSARPARCSRIGWWWAEPATTNKSMQRRVLKEMLQARSPCALGLLDQLAAQQVERRLAVELHVVERVGEDLRQPHEAGLHVPQEEQMHRAEQQRADADDQPDLAHVAHEFLAAVRRAAQNPKKVGFSHRISGNQRPDGVQDRPCGAGCSPP